MNGYVGLYTWVWQEKLKGRCWGNWILGSNHGGWGFNEDLHSGYVFFVNGLRTHIAIVAAAVTGNSFAKLASPLANKVRNVAHETRKRLSLFPHDSPRPGSG